MMIFKVFDESVFDESVFDGNMFLVVFSRMRYEYSVVCDD